MNIASIQFAGSNPSMGPHNSPSSNTLRMDSRPDALADLLDNTTVNGAIPLRAYLDLRARGEDSAVQRVHSAWKPDLNEGGRIIDLIVSFADGRSVTLHDLRRFSLTGSGYRRFEELIRKEGTVHREPSDAEMRVVPRDLPRPEISRPSQQLSAAVKDV